MKIEKTIKFYESLINGLDVLKWAHGKKFATLHRNEVTGELNSIASDRSKKNLISRVSIYPGWETMQFLRIDDVIKEIEKEIKNLRKSPDNA